MLESGLKGLGFSTEVTRREPTRFGDQSSLDRRVVNELPTKSMHFMRSKESFLRLRLAVDVMEVPFFGI